MATQATSNTLRANSPGQVGRGNLSRDECHADMALVRTRPFQRYRER